MTMGCRSYSIETQKIGMRYYLLAVPVYDKSSGIRDNSKPFLSTGEWVGLKGLRKMIDYVEDHTELRNLTVGDWNMKFAENGLLFLDGWPSQG